MAAGLAAVAPVLAQDTGLVRPIGIIIEKPEQAGVVLIRADQLSDFQARAGQLLFEGDQLGAFGLGARYLSCHKTGLGEIVELPPGLKKIQEPEPADIASPTRCRLPLVAKPIPASRQDGAGSVLFGSLAEPGEARELEQGLHELDEKKRLAVRGEIEKFREMLAQEPDSLVALVARAAVFDENGLDSDALRAYEAVGDRLGSRPAWLMSRLWAIDQRIGEAKCKQAGRVQSSAIPRAGGALQPRTRSKAGETFAVIVGISDYEDPTIDDLQYAHCDAIRFAEFLKSERGGSVPEENIALLVNDGATRAAIANALQQRLGGACGADKVVLYISGHGLVQRCKKDRPRAAGLPPDLEDVVAGENLCYYNQSGEGYVITHDTVAGGADIATTAFSVGDLQDMVDSAFNRVDKVQFFADVCRAGAAVGDLEARSHDASGQMFRNDQRKGLLSFFSSNEKQLSWEDKKYGGGHGAFTYFLLDALNGSNDAAARENEGNLGAIPTLHYVQKHIRDATSRKQQPDVDGDTEQILARAFDSHSERTLKGIHLEDYPFEGVLPADTCRAPSGATRLTRGWKGLGLSGDETLSKLATDFQGLLDDIQDGLSPPEAAARMQTILDNAVAQVPAVSLHRQSNSWRVELGDLAQEIMILYLKGEQVPQTRAEFVRGAAYLEALEVWVPGEICG